MLIETELRRKNKLPVYGISNIILSIFIIFIFTDALILNAQGRFLRGEIYKEFMVNSKEADFYISTNGNDDWTGTLAEPNKNGTDGPFATIGRAKHAVRLLKDKVYKTKATAIDKRFRGSPHKYGTGKDILVLLREGIYTLDSIVNFSHEDGGERIETDLPTGAFEYHKLKDHFVTYASYPQETAIISGGERIINWKKSQNGKYVVRINDYKVEELFANGHRQVLARTPNRGFFITDGQPADPSFFRYFKGDLKHWKGFESNYIKMIVRWSSINTKILKIDTVLRYAYLENPSDGMLNVPPKYFIENVEELIDTSGEWYYNNETKLLSYLPAEGIDNPNNATLMIPKLPGLFMLKGSSQKPIRNLRFYNLTFSTTGPGGNAAIYSEYSKNCEILNNTIKNVSQTAIKFGQGSYNNLVSKNKIYDVTGSGISIMGIAHPEHWNDAVYDNTISYNIIENCRPARTGISTANASRTKILHNYVSNTGSYGITIGSWPNVEESIDGSHLAEFNHVSFTNVVRDDEGGIAVYGMSPGSIVRNNLIHDVTPAKTNENVGLFFQNMAKGWTVINNYYYNLQQGEVKYCAAYPIDNIYKDNFVIETPNVTPEKIIKGLPKFIYSNLDIDPKNGFSTGEEINISTLVKNEGATGLDDVKLYIDGKVAKIKKFPIIRNDNRVIQFTYKFADPGEHTVSIGNAPVSKIMVEGSSKYLLFSGLRSSQTVLPIGDTILVSSIIENVSNDERAEDINCFVNGEVYSSKTIILAKGESLIVEFPLSLSKGKYTIKIGEQIPIEIGFYEYDKIDLTGENISQYCSGTAKPCEFEIDFNKNKYIITSSGTDFLHAEDSYGTLYLDDIITGNFSATVKIQGFGQGVSEWFRAGIFVRNNLMESNESERGSTGSFLMFTTPKRHGAQWDQFGEGSMHNTKSYNYKRKYPFPIWLKLIRHGNKFSGFYSFDGKEWKISRESAEIPALDKKMDIGLAAGTNDQKPSKVTFEDFLIKVEKK